MYIVVICFFFCIIYIWYYLQYPQNKKDLGERIIRVFEDHSKLLVFHYNALDAKEWMDFRYDMTQQNVTVKVFPNKLTCKFISDTIYKNMTPLFRTDTGVAFGNDFDLKKVLKVLGRNEKIELIGGKIEERLFNKQQIIEYSNLPTLDHARGELVQLLQQPSQTLSQLLQTNQTKLSMLLRNHAEQKESTPDPQ